MILPDWVKPGISFKDEASGKLWHIRAIVDGDQIVMRRWSKNWQDWYYVVEIPEWFQVRKDCLKVRGKSDKDDLTD